MRTNLDFHLEPEDSPEAFPCVVKCPKCHGAAKGVRYKAGTDIGPDGEPETLWEEAGVDCDECGHREGEECFEGSYYDQL